MHFVKYNLIGLLNTGITLLVVWVLHQVLGISVVVANFLGYVAGGLNSYLWNRHWNFKSKNPHREEVVRFLVVFGVSYLLNLAVLLGAQHCLLNWASLAGFTAWISQWFKPSFVANVIANVVYVVTSYGMYRAWVFKKHG
jgi:putative flippase GtrA